MKSWNLTGGRGQTKTSRHVCRYIVLESNIKFSIYKPYYVSKQRTQTVDVLNKPKIYMNFQGLELDYFDNLYMEPDTLLVSLKKDNIKHAKGEYLGESSFVDDFDKVLRDNRFEDIIDMLTRTYGRESVHNNW
ncbi:hypothetical protein AM593_03276, partial [Mytilus galloprovincialis]